MKSKFLTDFAVGIIVGFLIAVIICGTIAGLIYALDKKGEKVKYVQEYIEKRKVIEELLEDYGNRPVDEFLEIPGVRGAADGAADDFIRRRDAILHEFRSRHAD